MMKNLENHRNVKNGNVFIYVTCLFVILSMLFSNIGKSQTTFNMYSVSGHTETAFVEDTTEITLTEETISIANDGYLFTDIITSVEIISPTKNIYYTEGGDQFIFIGFNDDVYQVKWIGHYGGMISFFNVNTKK